MRSMLRGGEQVQLVREKLYPLAYIPGLHIVQPVSDLGILMLLPLFELLQRLVKGQRIRLILEFCALLRNITKALTRVIEVCLGADDGGWGWGHQWYKV
jgi:hypothetical protein